ncbi:acyl-CoA dehydrogenase family protein [Flexithrix dorotheae]|uniref:acyl-CoA dehydrogenase family protein n=1 Tax=Flexithrix dorotheae TaxID=70993 RepID=UPI0003761B46|nr:acyl-CoA dehydrogenase family protein [Flexithrix dorotheae]
MTTLFQTEKIQSILPKIQAFVKEEIIPLESGILSKSFQESEPVLNSLREKVKSAGLWNPHLPESLGGLGLSLVEFAQISEVLATTPLGHYVFNCQAPDIGNMEVLLHHGSAYLKEQFLTPLINGEIRSCFSMTEPEFAGSNPVLMATQAIKESGNYTINGHKWFTTAADGASFAIVMAVTNANEPNPYKRASLIIVPTGTTGFNLIRNISIMGEEGSGYLSHAEIQYEDCKVPLENLIGEEGHGFALAQERLGPGRIHHCMRWIGICERAFEMMCKRAVERELSPGVKLGEKQSIQNWIAESRAEINAARLMVLHTALEMEKSGAKAVRNEISTIKFYVADILQKVLDRSIQTHGALGLTDDLVLSFWYRHERGARIYDGPDEVHKSVLARNILKAFGLQIKR